MKFAMLYSCGKDSALALHRQILAGDEPVCLIVTYNSEAGRSWFHGVTGELLDEVADSLGIPVLRCPCTGENYEQEVERCLKQAGEKGAEAAGFGDIDIEEHLDWNRQRCRNAGLQCLTPLWQESREKLVYETIDAGFKAVVKCVDLNALDQSFLGETLDRDLVARIAGAGADICGENGEYHTFVYDGPLFKKPINICRGEKIDMGTHAAIDITLAEK